MPNIVCYGPDGKILDYYMQWDTGQKLIIKGADVSTAPVFHFSNNYLSTARVVESEIVDESISVNVPDVLLQYDVPIIVNIYYEAGTTEYSIRIPIRPRMKPDNYIFVDSVISNNVTNVFVAEYGKTTIDEIWEAAKAEKTCIAQQGNFYFLATSVASSRAVFSGCVNGMQVTILCNSDGWTRTNLTLEEAISEKSTHLQYPTSKAVHDYVKDYVENIDPPDWNAAEDEPGHILNRPFYDAKELLVQNTATKEGNSYFGTIINRQIGIISGEHYFISVNGVTYDCEARDVNMTINGISTPSVVIDHGNITDPDYVGVTQYNDKTVFNFNVEGTVTIAVYRREPVKIPERFLPDDVGGNALYVTVTRHFDGTETADKTNAELWQAFSENKAIHCVLISLDQYGNTTTDPVVLDLISGGENYCQFIKTVFIEGETVTWRVAIIDDVASVTHDVFSAVVSVNGNRADDNGNIEVAIQDYGGKVVILPETEVVSDYDGWYITTFIPNVTTGKTYTVKYNGVPYECVGVAVNVDGLKGVGLGNQSLIGGEDTGEPFGLLVLDKEIFDAMGLGAVVLRVSGDHPRTVGIEGEKTDGLDIINKGTVGQTVKIAAVDENGKPTAWEAVDSPDSDWNANEWESGHILNRTHWTDSIGDVILPETTLTTTKAGEFTITENAPALEIGKSYTVVYNGTVYTETAYDASTIGTNLAGGVALSNDGVDLTTGEGLIFGIVYLNGALNILDGDSTSTSVTISIAIGSEEVVHKLDNKYLDLDWIPVTLYDDIIPKTTLTAGTDLGSGIITDSIEEIGALEYGQTVYVCINDVWYDATVCANMDMSFIAAYGSETNFNSSELPERIDGKYLIGFWRGYDAYFMPVEAGTYTVQMTASKANHNKIPEEFLPESVDGIIIRSSDEGSNKKFKLTVDDSGTITVVEVTG